MPYYLQWETTLDQDIFDTVDHYECGLDKDVNPGLSEVTIPTDPIIGYSIKGIVQVKDIIVTPFVTDGLCKITGSLRTPWGVDKKLGRIELYDDTTMVSFQIYTNKAGDFFFFGVPGRRIKVFFQNGKKYWFMVPDKAVETFTNVVSNYGYPITEYHNQWTPKV